MIKYRLGRIRTYGWLCVILGALSILNFLIFYPFPGRAPMVGPRDPLWVLVQPMLMAVNIMHGFFVPVLLGYALLQTARIHEQLDRLAGDLEALRYRDRS